MLKVTTDYFHDSNKEVSFAEKVETDMCSSLTDMCHEWVRKRKECADAKQKIIQDKINQEIINKKILLELVEIAKSAMKNNTPVPISEDDVNEVFKKYDKIRDPKKINAVSLYPGSTPMQGWEGLVEHSWRITTDKNNANELAMIVTKCVFTGFIETFELILKNGQGWLSECGENGKHAYKHDRGAMQHYVILVTSAGTTLGLYGGIPNASEGRESEQRVAQSRWREHQQRVMGGNSYSGGGGSHHSSSNGGFNGMTGGFGIGGGMGGGMGGGCGGGGF